VRVQSLLNPDAEVEDIPTLTPALSRRERVVYAGCFRLMPMGMGGVHEAPLVIVRRRLALKFLRPDYARAYLGCFQREAEAAGALESDPIASALEFGIAADGSPFTERMHETGRPRERPHGRPHERPNETSPQNAPSEQTSTSRPTDLSIRLSALDREIPRRNDDR
jgi:hypothetical protein